MENSPSTAKIGLKWGLISGLTIVAFTAIMYVSNVASSSPLMYVAYLILIGTMVMGMRDFKANNSDFMSYGQGLGIGSFMGAITGLLSGIFTIAYIKFVDSELMAKQLDQMRMELEKKGQPAEQVEQIVSMSQTMMTPGIMFVMSTITYLIIGFIIALILSAVLRKNQPEMDF
jgi:hypothetical protein